MSRSSRETLAIPDAVRGIVDERDGRHCRVCGKYLGDQRALHHIMFGGDVIGMGGRRRHDPAEIVTVCWMWGGNCHDRVHADKHRYQGVLLEIARGEHPGRTALQLLRWSQRGGAGAPR